MIKRSVMALITAAIIAVIASGCKNQVPYKSSNFFAMDTYITVIYQSDDEKYATLSEDTIKEIEKVFSKTYSDSDVSRINKNETTSVSKECSTIVDRCLDIANKTDGAFNPALGCIINLWDINGKQHIPNNNEINSELKHCDYKSVTVAECEIIKTNASVKLDLGASVKGYAAQKVINILKENGIENAMINIGGNIAVTGQAEGRDGFWRVAVKNPFATDEIAGYIDCTDTVIAVSGDYERYFEKDGEIYHHIFDYKTGKPAHSGIKSVAVISEDGLVADALSTALFCMGTEKAIDFYNSDIYSFEAVIFEENGNVILTDGIKDKFILTQTQTLRFG